MKRARPKSDSNERALLSAEQRAVLDAILAGNNVFFTGSAGVGKSLTLRVVVHELRRKYGHGAVAVTASTGIAATHVGGTTLHSFAGVGLGTGSFDSILKVACRNPKTLERWHTTRVLVVDEVSMVAPDFFELLDRIGQSIRASTKPFGSIQLVLAGDFLQLPPVTKGSKEPVKYVFETETWTKAVQVAIELKHVFRQRNEDFVHLLQSVRRGVLTIEHDAMLQSRLNVKLSTDNGILPTRLYTHRADVDTENNKRLEQLDGRELVFLAKDTGKGAPLETLQKNCMAPATLKLRVGAQVMLLKNLQPPLLVNGSRGYVTGYERVEFEGSVREYPRVKFDNGTDMVMVPQEWPLESNGKTLAKRVQVPLCLAWALTVHKCQGMTLDKVIVDISSAWDPGQAYVALSRCTSLEGLSLLGYNKDKVRASAAVLNFYSTLNQ